jgi:hypothetical protein
MSLMVRDVSATALALDRIDAPARLDAATRSRRQRHTFRSEQSSISRQEGNPVHDAGCGDQLIGGIATYVEARTHAGDFASQGPHVNLCEYSDDLRVVQVHFDPAQLSQLGDFPKHNR